MADASTHQHLDQMITGYWISQAIHAAAKFGIADRLRDGPKTAAELAAATETQPAPCTGCSGAGGVGNFAEDESGRFALTPLAEPLRSDVPGSKRAFVMMTGDLQYRALAEIDHCVRTGEGAFDRVFGKPLFEYLGEHPDKAATFDAAMVGIHGREANSILDAYDFSAFGVVADIGGGNGSLLAEILKKHARLKGILFDLPHVVERAEANLSAAGVRDRCTLVGGSFLDAVPDGADALALRHIIHDWNDENSLTILRNCHRAMRPDGTLLLIESVIPPGNELFAGKFLDLIMMLIGGKERTEAEYRSLFEQAGFELTRIVPTATELSLVEGRKR